MKTERAIEEKANRVGEIRAGHDRLAVLYQGFLTAVVRVQGKREKIVDALTFRKRMKAVLQEVERSATALGYDFQDVQDAHLAVVAFLDEVILASDDPSRPEWMTLPLAHDLLGQPVAGEVFFERLEGLLRSAKDSSRLADVLEVYLLCLTLGFEGKYSAGRSAELHALMERSRSRIEGIRQQRGKPLSPESKLTDDVIQHGVVKSDRRNLMLLSVGAAIGALVLFVAAYLHLSYEVGEILTNLRR